MESSQALCPIRWHLWRVERKVGKPGQCPWVCHSLISADRALCFIVLLYEARASWSLIFLDSEFHSLELGCHHAYLSVRLLLPGSPLLAEELSIRQVCDLVTTRCGKGVQGAERAGLQQPQPQIHLCTHGGSAPMPAVAGRVKLTGTHCWCSETNSETLGRPLHPEFPPSARHG